eukprot:COSAG02_NODE_1520_length_12166_cov_8.338195_4_plen_53_part_00
MPGPDAGHSGKNKVNEFDQDAYVGLRPLDGHCAPHGSLVQRLPLLAVTHTYE